MPPTPHSRLHLHAEIGMDVGVPQVLSGTREEHLEHLYRPAKPFLLLGPREDSDAGSIEHLDDVLLRPDACPTSAAIPPAASNSFTTNTTITSGYYLRLSYLLRTGPYPATLLWNQWPL